MNDSRSKSRIWFEKFIISISTIAIKAKTSFYVAPKVYNVEIIRLITGKVNRRKLKIQNASILKYKVKIL